MPLISVLTWRVFGAAVFGMVIVGPLPAAPAVTVGSAPPPSEVCVPVTPAVLSNDLSMSITKTTVSLGPTPIDELPAVPNASLGGITASTRLPTFWPSSAVARPGSSVPVNSVGTPSE